MSATVVKLPTIEEIKFINTYRVLFDIDGDFPPSEDRIYGVKFLVSVKNGEKWEDGGIKGHCRWDGCSNWRMGDGIMAHFCGREDFELLAAIYDRCGELMGGYD